jgi:hypothetical protein
MLAESAPSPGKFHANFPIWALHNGVLERQQGIGSKGGILMVSASATNVANPMIVALRFEPDANCLGLRPPLSLGHRRRHSLPGS